MRPKIHGAIREEYEDLYEKLNVAARARGEIGPGQLADAASTEEKPEYRDLARNLIRFLEREKHILYPASVLIGEYIRAKIDLDGMRAVRLPV